MALSEIQQAEVNRRLGAFCEARVPPSVRNQVRVSFRIQGTEVVLFEERPRDYSMRSLPIQLRSSGDSVYPNTPV